MGLLVAQDQVAEAALAELALALQLVAPRLSEVAPGRCEPVEGDVLHVLARLLVLRCAVVVERLALGLPERAKDLSWLCHALHCRPPGAGPRGVPKPLLGPLPRARGWPRPVSPPPLRPAPRRRCRVRRACGSAPARRRRGRSARS